MKILFTCITQYHILNSIIYKLKHFPNDEAIIMVTEYRYNNLDIKSLRNIFKEVIPYDPTVRFNFDKQPQKIYNIDESLRNYGYKISEFNLFFVSGTQYAFGIYLVQKNIEFYMFEEAAGILSNLKQLIDIDFNINPLMANHAKINGLYDGENKFIKKIICNKYAQKKELLSTKIEHFDCTEALKLLEDSKKDLVLSYYLQNSKLIEINLNSVMIFTQSYMNLKIHTLENQCLIYQYFIDYFYPTSHIVFKTHPDDILYYGMLFPKATVIRDKFPAEIIPYVFTNQPKEIATICSTAVDNLKRYFPKSFQLDSDYGHTDAFLSTHKVYTGLCYVNQMNKNSKIFIVGYPVSLFNGFIDKIFHNLEIVDNIDDADYIFIDDYIDNNYNVLYKTYEMINDKQQIIYINSKSMFLEYDLFYDKIENIKPIVLSKKVNREEHIYQNLEDEIIFVICKCNNFRLEFKMEKELENTGITLETTELTKDQIRIKVLEGILEATEKRLLYTLEENKKLKEQLGANE